MRTVRRNSTPMKYSLYLGRVDVVDTNYEGNPLSYKDSEGNTYYVTTGEKKEIYGEPIDFSANISEAGGEAESMVYGLNTGDYEAVGLFAKNAYPIVEGAYVWVDSNVEYEDEQTGYYTVDGKSLIEVHTPDKTSADYVVKKVTNSLNFTLIILDGVVK